MTYRPIVLTVLDGWGCREALHGNAIAASKTPHWLELLGRYPWTTIQASGEDVGLPKGIMGNSEVGHMNLGSGRLVEQGVTIIDKDIAAGDLPNNETLKRAIEHAKVGGKRVHFMGLLSDGQVHSSIDHLLAMLEVVRSRKVEPIVHAFLDGRDTPPESAETYVRRLQERLRDIGSPAALADITGRFYAMDRDHRWERTKLAYDLLANGKAEHREDDAVRAVLAAYERGETDEFVAPTTVGDARPIEDGDSCVFFNFRPDRARQLTTALDAGIGQYASHGFDAFPVRSYANVLFATMTRYDETFTNPALFGPRPQFDTFGEVVSAAGLKQLRLAETEKYAHVTYFFNGGREDVFDGEDRTLIPSNRTVETYDLAPEMRAKEITDAAIASIQGRAHDVIVMNYANADMIGHTGKWEPTIAGVELLDECLARLSKATLAAGGLLAITADHGNAEEKIDADGNPLTAHTTNPVPFVLIADDLKGTLAPHGKLGDVAPTLLEIVGLPVPERMTGNNLFVPNA
ncbi:MAG TPA: 2,3-bisphosphoglycerate-independent phosphoglycerate mutase [Candidatus Baltobacteraceae bacterium]